MLRPQFHGPLSLLRIKYFSGDKFYFFGTLILIWEITIQDDSKLNSFRKEIRATIEELKELDFDLEPKDEKKFVESKDNKDNNIESNNVKSENKKENIRKVTLINLSNEPKNVLKVIKTQLAEFARKFISN
jgi:hypothetical protein